MSLNVLLQLFSPQYMKGPDGWLLHALNSIPPLCVCECVGIMPSDGPPPAWSPSPPLGQGGVGFDPSSQEEVLGKIC